MSTTKEIAHKTLVAQTSDVLVKKIVEGKLIGISKEVALEILEKRKEKGSFTGTIPKDKVKTETVKEPKAAKEPKAPKEPKVKKEKVAKEPKEAKTFKVNGVVHTAGDKVKFEAANNHPLKEKNINGKLISIHYNENNKTYWVRAETTVEDVKYKFWKKYDAVKFV